MNNFIYNTLEAIVILGMALIPIALIGGCITYIDKVKMVRMSRARKNRKRTDELNQAQSDEMQELYIKLYRTERELEQLKKEKAQRERQTITIKGVFADAVNNL